MSLTLPEPLQVTDKSQLSEPGDTYRWKETYVYGAGGKRVSMTYLPAYDANNGWDPKDGTGGAEPGVAPRTLYYLNDALGSAIGLIEKDGRVSSRYHYDEFGIPQDAKKFDPNWPGPDNLYGYTGLGYDFNSGLTYARARYYQPELGRFISEDSYTGDITNPLSLNLYTYCLNNPINRFDPSGHDSYVLYTSGTHSDFTSQAKYQKEELEKAGETVHLLEVNAIEEFNNAWNSMGTVDGEAVNIASAHEIQQRVTGKGRQQNLPSAFG